MGISCDFEAGSMESEIKPTCNKEFVKLNGLNDATDANVATATTTKQSEVITIADDDKTTETPANIPSPTAISQEPETIVIIDDVDDAGPEEGEILNSDNDCEYEAISSDEEFSLRQKIEALEAKNRELEKIATISASTDYGYRRSPNYASHKQPSSNRSNSSKTISPLSSFAKYKPFPLSHVENISSDEAQIIESDDDFSSIFESSKSYGRSHRAIKKEKRQSRRKTRPIENEKDRCSLHGKRRCLDIDCIPIEAASTGKKRVRHKHDDRKTSKYSSDSENELLGKREKLKMALNIIAPSNKTNNSSTLSHKLTALRALEDGKKSVTKHKKRKLSKSPDRNLSVRKRTRSKENASKRPKIESDRRSQDKIASPIPVIQDNLNENEVQEDEDLISLEEQELRLIALKSAVLRKHEARKRKQQTIQLATQLIEHVGRPYSPTDSVVFVPDENGEKTNDCIDSDNNNMDISPISSPDRNSCQPMDMDLASSNENSNSPIFSYEKPQTFAPFEQFIDWGAVAIPMPINAAYVEMDQTSAAAAAAVALSQPYAMQPFPLMFDQMQKDTLFIENSGAKPIQMNLKEQMVNNTHMDSEDELRAQLIRQMRNTSAANSSKAIETTEKIVPKESFNNVDDTLEEDCLRSLLLSSKGKKSNAIKSSTDTSASTAPESTAPFTKSDQTKCDDIPKLTLNLREALKRIKGNQQNKAAVGATATTATMITPVAVVEPPKMESINEEISSNTLEVCDHKETPKTDVNNHLDKNENELSTVENVPLVIPSKQSQEKTKTIRASNVVIEASNVVIEATKANKLVSPKTVKETKTVLPMMKKASQDEAISDKMLKPPPIKVAEKSIPTKIAVEPDQKSQVSKPIAPTKPKPKIKAKPKPVAAPLKSQNSTISTANKTTATLTMTNMASSPALKAATTVSPISPMAVTNINKIEATRKSSGSPIVTNWVPKPVKKLIISLNADSSSDENDQDSKFIGSSTSKKPDTTSQTNDSSNTFQLRLDQFLQKVRANIETTVPETKQPVSAPAATKPKTLANRTSNSTEKTQTTSKRESSKAVAHLPMSSQLEYHRLLNRMKLLEKQKEQKSRQSNDTSTPSVLKTITPKTKANFSSLKVTVQNENRFIQTEKTSDSDNGGMETASDTSKISTAINKVPTTKTLTPTSTNTSLAKRVLVKNAIDSLISTKVADDETKVDVKVEKEPAAKPAIAASVQTSVTNEQPSNSASENNGTAETKPAPLSLEMFAKKPAKVKASVLANYVNKYRSHGEKYLNGLTKLHRLTCRTSIETKKQQKLEQVLEELQRQAKIVEEKLVQQKLLTQRLQPAILATEKAIAADRIMFTKLENCCNRLGTIANGPDYKIKSDKETEIKDKLKQIAIEKNRLRILGPKPAAPQVSKQPIVAKPQPNTIETPVNTFASTSKLESCGTDDKVNKSLVNCAGGNVNGIKEKKDTSGVTEATVVKMETDMAKVEIEVKSNSTGSNLTESNPIETKPTKLGPIESNQSDLQPIASSSIESNPVELNLVEQKTAELTNICQNEIETPNDPSPEISKSIPMKETSLITVDNSTVEVNEIEIADKPNDKPPSSQPPPPQSSSSDNLTEQQHMTTDSEAICGKYDSPLAHMQNCGVSKPSVCVADRNAIVCPYDLMGRCEDKQCEFKHLSS